MKHAVERRALLLLLGLALVPRLAVAGIAFFHHPDEIWQYLEPAYYLGTGRWIETWEWRYGMRSWLLPTLFAAPYWLVHGLTADPATGALAVRIAVAIASLTVVAAGTAVAARSSRTHAIVTGLVLATSSELVFFASRPLSENVATDALLVAALLLTRHSAARRPHDVIAAGLAMGLCFAFRFQMAPALAVLALLTLRTDRRAWGWAMVGVFGALGADAIANLAQGAAPFRYVLVNVELNRLHSASFGTEPWWWYLAMQAALWSWLAVPMLALIAIGARRVPVLVAVAAVHIAVHSLIPHKEVRFILPATALLLVVAGIGGGELLARAGTARARYLATGALALFWVGIGAAAMLTPAGRSRFNDERQMDMLQTLHRDAGLCGIASYRQTSYPIAYSLLDRAVPVYSFHEADAARALRAHLPAANAVVLPRHDAGTLLGSRYRLAGCFGGRGTSLCLFRRPGACAPGDPHYRENAVRARVGN